MDLLRGRRHRALIALSLLIASGYPAYRALLWSEDRGWSPPLPEWRALNSVTLPNGVIAEVVTHRNPHDPADRCRVISTEGTRWFDGAFFTLGAVAETGSVGLGEDLLGNGGSGLVIMTYSGGAHCCETYFVFELLPGACVRQVAELDAAHGGGFKDLDGDGVPEFVVPDWEWAYELACFACLAPPNLVYRATSGGYVLATDLMATPPPSAEEFRRLVSGFLAAARGACQDVAASERPPSPRAYFESEAQSGLWSAVLQLLYGGHEELAWALLDWAWPAGFDGRDERVAAFSGMLEAKSNRAALREMHCDADAAVLAEAAALSRNEIARSEGRPVPSAEVSAASGTVAAGSPSSSSSGRRGP